MDKLGLGFLASENDKQLHRIFLKSQKREMRRRYSGKRRPQRTWAPSPSPRCTANSWYVTFKEELHLSRPQFSPLWNEAGGQDALWSPILSCASNTLIYAVGHTSHLLSPDAHKSPREYSVGYSGELLASNSVFFLLHPTADICQPNSK